MEEWIVVPSHIFRTDCDVVPDTIADPAAQAEAGLQVSKPYYRSGVTLALPRESSITLVASLGAATKVGVQVGSIAAMELNQNQVAISTFGFEDDMLAALARSEIAAAAVSPLSTGYYKLTHSAAEVRIWPLDVRFSDLVWNVSVGRANRPKLREAINAAIDQLRVDETTARIYARYGITLEAARIDSGYAILVTRKIDTIKQRG